MAGAAMRELLLLLAHTEKGMHTRAQDDLVDRLAEELVGTGLEAADHVILPIANAPDSRWRPTLQSPAEAGQFRLETANGCRAGFRG